MLARAGEQISCRSCVLASAPRMMKAGAPTCCQEELDGQGEVGARLGARAHRVALEPQPLLLGARRSARHVRVAQRGHERAPGHHRALARRLSARQTPAWNSCDEKKGGMNVMDWRLWIGVDCKSRAGWTQGMRVEWNGMGCGGSEAAHVAAQARSSLRPRCSSSAFSKLEICSTKNSHGAGSRGRSFSV